MHLLHGQGEADLCARVARPDQPLVWKDERAIRPCRQATITGA